MLYGEFDLRDPNFFQALDTRCDLLSLAFFQDLFSGGSIVMQVSIVMLIFLLFSDQISGGSL